MQATFLTGCCIMTRMKKYLSLLLFLLVACPYSSLKADDSAKKPDTTWFEDDRFGMFIHFGLYSIPAGVWEGVPSGRNGYAEWIRYQWNWPKKGGIPRADYDKLLAQFNPQGFDADAWVREAKRAGMKYFLITAKHHDGFALWDSKVSDYNVVKATPFKRDILAELAAACRKHGLKLGFYYSHWLDWEHPNGAPPPWPELKQDPTYEQPTDEQYEQYWTGKCLPQVKELLVNFKPDFMWFDSWGSKTSNLFLTDQRLQQLITLVRENQPTCLVNSRIGTTKNVDYLSMGDNYFPKKGFDQPWETSGTLNHSWGYHRLDYRWKNSHDLLLNLVNNTSRGGNYQLNVGPTDVGIFQPAAIRRLREIGAWMTVNGGAIYGTRPSAYPEPEWGRLTEKTVNGKKRLNVFVFKPKGNDTLSLSGPDTAPAKAWVLETDQPVKVEKTDTGLSIKLPPSPPDPDITTLVLEW
jgi:alpha-L-fucosidase